MSSRNTPHVVVIGAGIGGLTAAALLAQADYRVTVLEAMTYPGGCAGTFFNQGYRFDAGATVAGGFHANGPHTLVGERLGIAWPVRPADPAWIVHLPERQIVVDSAGTDVLHQFPASKAFWREQARLADLGWALAARGLPWPPTHPEDLAHLARVGIGHLADAWRAAPFAFRTARDWLKRHGLAADEAFGRFIDGQLLVAAQTTSEHANALYSATALDLARQGVYHVAGGMSGLAQMLADRLKTMGGEIQYRQRVTRIAVTDGRATGVYVRKGRRAKTEDFLPADFVIANMTPWSLHELLGEASPPALRQEVRQRPVGWGAYVLHLGVDARKLPADLADHHQIITTMRGPLGEGRSIFLSLSPTWDADRAPRHHRAVTVTTHTAVEPWWDLMADDLAGYYRRKQDYAGRILDAIEAHLPGFRASVTLTLPGSPLTYAHYTGRHLGMVGGFPQTSLFRARGPQTGLVNLRLVGDSIFPGQSTAGVTLGALRVAAEVERRLPRRAAGVIRARPLRESVQPSGGAD